MKQRTVKKRLARWNHIRGLVVMRCLTQRRQPTCLEVEKVNHAGSLYRTAARDLASGSSGGEWTREPDFKRWLDQSTGYACEIRRNRFGVLCGYVLVPKAHPDFGKPREWLSYLRVHGGITWSETEGDRQRIGFDCAHGYDLMPSMVAMGMEFPDLVYRNFAFVREQCEVLAIQLKAMETAPLGGTAMGGTDMRVEPDGEANVLRIVLEYGVFWRNSPDTGDPDCLCSICRLPIAETLAPILRCIDDLDPVGEARYHHACIPFPGVRQGYLDAERRAGEEEDWEY